MARERKQWEAHEERLVEYLRQMQQQNAPTGLPSRNMKPLEQTGNGYHFIQAVGYHTSSHHKLAELRIQLRIQFLMSLSPLHC